MGSIAQPREHRFTSTQGNLQAKVLVEETWPERHRNLSASRSGCLLQGCARCFLLEVRPARIASGLAASSFLARRHGEAIGDPFICLAVARRHACGCWGYKFQPKPPHLLVICAGEP
jgi:hypothetical protein